MKIKIEDLSHDGRGIGRIDGKAVFVPRTYPDEVVEIQIKKDKKRFFEGETLNIIEESKYRIDTICSDFYRCGGCQFCDYEYSQQLEYKKNRVINDFKKFANLAIENIKVNGMENFHNYRNHVQFRVKNGEIGYLDKESQEIFTPEDCIIAPQDTDNIIEVLKEFSEINKVSLIGIRENHLKEKMLILVVQIEKLPNVRKRNSNNEIKTLNLNIHVIEKLKALNVTHIYQNFNPNPKYHYGNKSIKLYGEGEFQEEILGNKFILSPTSFFQVNRTQAEILYKKGIENLNLNSKDKVLELYSGIGTITMEIAKRAKEVTAIEYAKSSVEDAKLNAKLNGIDNIKFISGKVEEKLESFDKTYKKILLDPPRAGANREVIEKIIELKPEIISYISCDPATLSRDVGLLINKGNYKIENIEIVDLFPLSSHVETIALLQREIM
jgi:23S rRNA (uracil1939-C5)-methyltransferase